MSPTDEQIFYTGVGARVTPLDVQEAMTEIAKRQSKLGRILRSGGQPKGADGAFERGAGVMKQIFKPNYWQGEKQFKILNQAYVIAAQHHPAWPYLSQYAKDLMARNVHAVLGPQLDNPSDHLICWTADGVYQTRDRTANTGGTGHAIAVACTHGVPVFNLNNKVHYKYVLETLTV